MVKILLAPLKITSEHLVRKPAILGGGVGEVVDKTWNVMGYSLI